MTTTKLTPGAAIVLAAMFYAAHSAQGQDPADYAEIGFAQCDRSFGRTQCLVDEQGALGIRVGMHSTELWMQLVSLSRGYLYSSQSSPDGALDSVTSLEANQIEPDFAIYSGISI